MNNVVKLSELLPSAIKLRLEVFCDEQGIDRKEELTGDDNLFNHYYLFVDNVLVSYARARKVDDYYLIGRVVTRKEYRNKGYSSKVIKYIEEDAKANGANKLKLHAQDVSLEFYKKLGFKVTSEQYIEAGVEHHNMEKYISNN